MIPAWISPVVAAGAGLAVVALAAAGAAWLALGRYMRSADVEREELRRAAEEWRAKAITYEAALMACWCQDRARSAGIVLGYDPAVGGFGTPRDVNAWRRWWDDAAG